MSNAVLSEIQKLEPSAIVVLFEVDLTPFGGELLRFHAGTNALNQNVVWQGNTYTRYPVEASGFDFAGDGSIPRPKIRVSNVFSAITALMLAYQGMLGANVTRKRTLVKFLDAVNFAGGVNPSADPTAEFPNDIFIIDRKTNENRDFVEFELTPSFDLAGVMLPRRQVVQNVCAWKYRGAECGYTDPVYFEASDAPTTDSTKDVCGKRLTSCKIRFGATAELPYGAFPGADLFR